MCLPLSKVGRGPRWLRAGGGGRWKVFCCSWTTQKCAHWALQTKLPQQGKWGPCPEGQHQLSRRCCRGNKTLPCAVILHLAVSCCQISPTLAVITDRQVVGFMNDHRDCEALVKQNVTAESRCWTPILLVCRRGGSRSSCDLNDSVC